MTATEAKATVTARMEQLAERYDLKKSKIQIRLAPDEAKALLNSGCPVDMLWLKEKLRNKNPTHVLLRPKVLEAILQHGTNKRTADISGRKGPSVDNQAHARLD